MGIPAFNEEKNIASIITKLKKITDSIIVCDDGSSDMTAEISKNLGATVISHKKNMGYGVAINSIFQKSKEKFEASLNMFCYSSSGSFSKTK